MPTIKQKWRASKRKGTNTIQFSRSALIDSCYKSKYVDVLVACADENYCSENVKFIAAVNRLELLYVGSVLDTKHRDHKYDWMPDTTNMVQFAAWILQQFVVPGARSEINVDSTLRKNTCRQSSPQQMMLNLRACRKICAKLVGDMSFQFHWQSKTPYIKQLWMMNKKLGAAPAASDSAKVAKAVDLKLKINRQLAAKLEKAYG